MPTPTYHAELQQLIKYLYSESSEDAKRPLLFPLFQKLNKEKFKSESDASSTDIHNEETAEHALAFALVTKIKELHKKWNLNYCKGQFIQHVGLKDEPYFKYFDYPDFLTPYSGLIQIRKYAEVNGCGDLLDLFGEIQGGTKRVREEIYRLLVVEFKYFD